MDLAKRTRLFANIIILAVALALVLYLAYVTWRFQRRPLPTTAQAVPSSELKFAGNDKHSEDQKHVVSAAELRRILDRHHIGIVVLDIRERDRFAQGHIPSALNIPSDEVEVRAEEELSKSDLIVVSDCMCDGTNGESLIRRGNLIRLGFSNVEVLSDGIDGWKRSGFSVATQ
jgi:rhodanese-related sulfurtransferase